MKMLWFKDSHIRYYKIGCGICGLHRNGTRPDIILVSQSEVSQYIKESCRPWQEYLGVLRNATRKSNVYVYNDDQDSPTKHANSSGSK